MWGEWFDWDLITKLAENSDISINLIGDNSGIMDRVNSMPENVHFLGIKKQTDLPAYLSFVDFTILPFKPGSISDYVSPLKIFEYIAMGKYVLTTKLPDLENYPNLYASNKCSDWLKKLTKMLK